MDSNTTSDSNLSLSSGNYSSLNGLNLTGRSTDCLYLHECLTILNKRSVSITAYHRGY